MVPFSSSVFFIWFEIVSVFIIVSALIFFLPIQEGFSRAGILKIIAAALTILIVFPLGTHQIWSQLNFRNEKLVWINQKLSDLNKYFLRFLKEPKLMIIYFVLTCIVFMTFSRMTQASFDAISRPVSFSNAVLFTAILFITRSVNIVPGNIGISEIICGYFAEILGNTVGEGIIVSSIIRIINYVFLAILSLFYLRFNFKEFRQNRALEDS